MNIFEKTTENIADKIADGFGWIRELAKTKLWLASILGALYLVSVIVGSIVSMVLILALILASALGVLLLCIAILSAIGFLYTVAGGLVFFGSLFFIVFVIVTLFMKKELKHENFFDED